MPIRAEENAHGVKNSRAGRNSDLQQLEDSHASQVETSGSAQFRAQIAQRFAEAPRKSYLAFIDVEGLDDEYLDGGEDERSAARKLLFVEIAHAAPDALVGALGSDSFLLMFEADSPAVAHKHLRGLAHKLARSSFYGVSANLTPAIGYAEARLAKTPDALWDKAQKTLDVARYSLEIEPVRYSKHLERTGRPHPFNLVQRLWGGAPAWMVLSFQFFATTLLGLGIPFLTYAVCDALGFDISGIVYLTVVAILFATASLIWVEGFLAVRPTDPPEEPGEAYPPATIIIAAYLPNEADTIMETLEAFLRLEYPNEVQIIVAYNTPEAHHPVEDEMHALAARVRGAGRFVVEPLRVAYSRSKAQNVNAAICGARGAFIGVFDADHQPRPHNLTRAWRWLSNGWDVVQGRCAVRNADETWVSRMIAVEFEQIYAVSHPGRARLHGFGIFGGSNGYWRTETLHATRMRHSMLTEDIDSSIRALEKGAKIASDRDIISDELAPTTVQQLLNQRLRWAQGWFQVSLRRLWPCMTSSKLSLRQKTGLFHLLVWREVFQWLSIQVIPILAYWVWIHGWGYINWTVPLFLAATIYITTTGLGQILFTYALAQPSYKARPRLFFEYALTSTFFFTPFKDALSRIAHLKEAMREKVWRVTPRTAQRKRAVPAAAFGAATAGLALALFFATGDARAASPTSAVPSAAPAQTEYSLRTLFGGQAKTIASARRAAKEGRHADAVAFFEAAIQAVPRRRLELLAEYAEQLMFAGRSDDAVPLYDELLARPRVKPSDIVDYRNQRALALTWAGRHQAALTDYDELLRQEPGDVTLVLSRARVSAWMGREQEALGVLDGLEPDAWRAGEAASVGSDILVSAARAAARTDQNDAAVELFKRALAHNPNLREQVLREYADQLTFVGEADAAVPLYREVLSQPVLDPVERRRASRAEALALSRSDDPEAAAEAWRAYLATYTSSDDDARLNLAWALSSAGDHQAALKVHEGVLSDSPTNDGAARGVFDERVNLARAAARSDRNDQAAPLFQAAVEFAPDRRREVLREYADQLLFAGDADAALPLYGEVLASPALEPLELRRARRARALALTRSGRSAAAVDAWRDYIEEHPEDAEDAPLNLAWTLSSAGRHGESLAVHRAVLVEDPSNAGARRGVFDETVNMARVAARADQNERSARLFGTAAEFAPARRREILREYADQLTFVGAATAALPLYREYLAAQDLPQSDRVAAELGLARAYAWAGREDEARRTYKKLSRAYPGDVDVQWAVLVAEARGAARRDANDESRRLFAEALDLHPARRAEILSEYADQLSYAGQAGKAAPVYQEALARPDLAPGEAHVVRLHLARAYLWSNQPDAALREYKALAASAPDDAELQWRAAVGQARVAAQTDANDEARRMFARALELRPERRHALLIEYADQLSYAGEADKAAPLYEEALRRADIAPGDAVSARLSLARAYLWSDQPDAALREYRTLAASAPEDAELQWHAMVAEARIAAQTDANAEARRFFAKAVDLMPERRQELLREYADQTTFAGAPEQAVPLYEEFLAAADVSDQDRTAAALGMARAYAWSGRLDDARKTYSALARANPHDHTLHWHAVVADARFSAQRDQNRRAGELFEQALAIMPERRADLLREYADQLSFSGRAEEAAPLYREYLTNVNLGSQDRRRAELSLARALAWSHDHAGAVAAYESLIERDPMDFDARDGYARTLAWQGRRKASIKAYRETLNLSPNNQVAQLGLAEVLGWNGQHRAAQRTLRARLASAPGDLEARRLLAQSYQWMGRPDKALNELDRIAEQVRAEEPAPAEPVPTPQDDRTPALREAEALRAELLAAQRPLARTAYRASRQSDSVDIGHVEASYRTFPARGRAELGVGVAETRYDPEDDADLTVRAAGLSGSYRFSDFAALTGNVWGNRIDPSAADDRTRATYDAFVTLWPNDTLRFDISQNRQLFDNVTSLENGITATTRAVSMDVTPWTGLRFTARGAYADFSDGNERLSGEGEVVWRAHEGLNLDLGLRLFGFEFDEQLDNGYFNPETYFSQEVLVRTRYDLTDRLGFDFAAAAGAEQADPGGSKPIVRSELTFQYLVNDKVTFDLTGGYFSSDQSETGGFSRTSLTFGLNYRFG